MKSNLINFFLTNKGERYLNPSFGANIRSFIFEGITEGNIEMLQTRIQEDVNIYFPNVKIEKINILKNEDYNLIKIEITYNVINFGIEDTLDLIIQ